MQKELKPKRKYAKKGLLNPHTRISKCGHLSNTGRYFNCEKCIPILPDDNGDWDYFNLGETDSQEES